MNNEQFFFYLAFENSECIRCFSILTEGLFKKIYMNPGNDNEITLQIAWFTEITVWYTQCKYVRHDLC